MTTGKLINYWTLIIILLVAIITVGGTVAWAKYSPSQPIEISIPPTQELPGEIYIGGAISNPGFYPLKIGDSIEAIIQAGGGITSNADLSWLKLYIPEVGEEEQSQKINLNRAEAWLLEALPGIGETLAQRIIDYREQNGLFSNINELTKVKGIGTTTYEEIKHLITVAD
jgi:competence protein ComEA